MPELTVLGRPWEKRHNETATAYERFLGFLDWPGELHAFASNLGAQLNLSPQAIREQATQHDWRARKEAWLQAQIGAPADIDELEERRLRQRARSRVRLHAYMAEKFLGKAEKLVDLYMEREVRDEETGEVLGTALVRGVLREASEALAKGIEMERLSYGLPVSITRVEHDIRAQVEVALNIQNRILAVITAHVCEECQKAVTDELEQISGEVDAAQQEILRLR